MVVPCYLEEQQLPITAPALERKVTQLIADHAIAPDSCILFVDDGSQDATWQVIEDLHLHKPHLFHGIRLAHNRGHQNALFAGLMTALRHGYDAAASMDADLQDDTDALDRMVDAYRNGSQIVYGVRSSRAKDTWFKRTTAEIFYKLQAWLGAEIIPDHADYRLMGRQSLQALSQYHEVNLFLRGIVPQLGFPTAIVEYERGRRAAGESKYPLRKMLAFAIQGITSFSTKPLKFVTGTGVLAILVGLAMLIYTFISLFTGNSTAGWASLMCSLWLIGGLLMLGLGIVGEYIGKIYLETKHRPRYNIEKTI